METDRKYVQLRLLPEKANKRKTLATPHYLISPSGKL